MPSLLDDPEAYAFAAQIAEDERKKRGLQSLLGGIGGLLEAPVNYVKERATALATDPIGDMKRTMQGTIDRAKQREQLQQIAYGDPQNPTRVTDQAAADQLAQDYLDMASTIMPAGMTVFHGSPYKFNAFAPKAIGSGEGAQAYGYGHYVAESPEIAKSYATNLSNRDIANQGRLNAHANAKRLAELAGDAQYAADDIRFVLENNPFHEQKNLLTETLDLLESGNYAKPLASQGNFYKIDLPDEQIDKMLDWDAEISKQTSEIQKLAKQYGLNMDDLGGDLVAAMNAKLPEGAEAMRSAGVPGIKYFDAQSRGGQQADTRNFVVFPKNEGLLKIEEVNGQPVQSGLLDTDYRGSHSAPGSDFGAPLHDLTGGGQMYPADVYSPKAAQYYGAGEAYDQKAFNIAQSFKGKPNAMVTIYRAVPKVTSNSEKLATLEKQMAAYMKRGTLPENAQNYSSGSKWYDAAYEQREKLRNLADEPVSKLDINSGDWVTLTKEYAKDHGEHALKGQYKILSKKVRAKDLWTNADSIHEFGYNPNP
jgi:hypothetical protein